MAFRYFESMIFRDGLFFGGTKDFYNPGSLVYAENLTDIGNKQTVKISNNPNFSFSSQRTGDIGIDTILENGENLGLVRISFGILTSKGFLQQSTIDARQTGFSTEQGISFRDGRGELYYLSGLSEKPQAGQSFILYNDGSQGTFTATTIFNPCYLTGTQISTINGQIRVEDLKVGDIVVTASGEHKPIRWIGHRTLDCAHHHRPEAVWPIRVLADAFGPGLPVHDLWLSPDHAVCVTVLDEILIPVKHLVNDATVAQVPMGVVTYWHVELDSHDILLAEGLPAESFLDTGVRAGFQNGGMYMVPHLDFTPLTLEDFCRPLVQGGPIVDAVRLRLVARAKALGWRLTEASDLHLIVDGQTVRPSWNGTVARFHVPVGAAEVRLVSRTFVPERVRPGAGDGRLLGVALRGCLTVETAEGQRTLSIDSQDLSAGFSFVQGESSDPWRWTTGDARLPSDLWRDCTEPTFLTIETAPDRGTLQAWLAPNLQGNRSESECGRKAA